MTTWNVMPDGDGWKVTKPGVPEATRNGFATKEDAFAEAKRRAKEEVPARVFVRRPNGNVETVVTYKFGEKVA